METRDLDLSEDAADSDDAGPFWYRRRTQFWMIEAAVLIAVCALVMWLGCVSERIGLVVAAELDSVEIEERPATPAAEPGPARPGEPVALTRTEEEE